MNIYYPIKPLDNPHDYKIHEKHFLLKVHFEYSKFVLFYHEVKNLFSIIQGWCFSFFIDWLLNLALSLCFPIVDIVQV